MYRANSSAVNGTMKFVDATINVKDGFCDGGCVGMVVGIILFLVVLLIIAVVIRVCCKPKTLNTLCDKGQTRIPVIVLATTPTVAEKCSRRVSRDSLITSDALCAVCSTKKDMVCLVPCGHRCCARCAHEQLTTCHLCQAPIAQKVVLLEEQ
jgi:hypothetical protein